ncbi:MAG: RAMP superfamily CRISPR-associated protein, partial [Epsilonproteobacteria bacterium]|nr:RAMP superfamily CRISPR-associated protein [Campylobacterota bacterium]
MITAPYNFVPLNKEVFYPSWSEDVSHDVPFEDGESGEIDITITAKSPIFIRNHSDDKEKPSVEFCHFIYENGAKEFYIPGSSFKGMVRSVLEIMSFSKIAIDEEKFKKPISVRDMTNQKELVGTANGCGFLIKNGDTYQIEDCGNILTISHFDLQKNYPNIKKLETAKIKYEQFGFQVVKYLT